MPGWHISGGGGGGGGTGDVVGPASSTDNAIVRFDLATGKLLQNSDVTVSDPAAAVVTMATTAGNAFALVATAPTATTGASQAGKAASLTASAAVASTDTAGAAAGGDVTITAGAAARNTSGNANGGNVTLTPGAGIGTGITGIVEAGGSLRTIHSNAVVSYNSSGIQFGNNTSHPYMSGWSTDIAVGQGGVMNTALRTTGVSVKAAGLFNWSSTTSPIGTADAGLARSAAGVVKVTDGSTGIRGLQGGGTAVASATAMPLPTGRVFHVTGTTTITSITSTNFQSGAVITLIFDDILTFTDGSNLKLAGDFVTTTDDTITLAYDGTNWYECCRSVN